MNESKAGQSTEDMNFQSPETGNNQITSAESGGVMRKIEGILQQMPGGKWILPSIGLMSMFAAGMEKTPVNAATKKEKIANAAEYWTVSIHQVTDVMVGAELTCPQTKNGYIIERNNQGKIIMPSKLMTNAEIWAQAAQKEGTWAREMNGLIDRNDVTKFRTEDAKAFRIEIQTHLPNNQALANKINNQMTQFEHMIFDQSPETGQAFLYHDFAADNFDNNSSGVEAKLVKIEDATLRDNEDNIIRYGIGEDLAAKLRALPNDIEAKLTKEIIEQATETIEFGIQNNMAINFQEREGK